MNTNIVKLSGVKIYTDIGLWPYSADGVRLWSGSVRLDATEAEKDHWYKIRCSCYKGHMALFRCTHGSGRVKQGEVKHLSLKVPEPAIATAIVTVHIDGESADLNLYKLDGAEELYFGTGEPDKLAVVGRSPNRSKWECRDGTEGAFEIISTLIKPLFENVPNRLSDYLMEATCKSTIWQRLNELVYPVVLELLQDLGEFAKKESRKFKVAQSSGLNKPLSGCLGNDVAELVLIRLSEKLRHEYGILSVTPNSS